MLLTADASRPHLLLSRGRQFLSQLIERLRRASSLPTFLEPVDPPKSQTAAVLERAEGPQTAFETTDRSTAAPAMPAYFAEDVGRIEGELAELEQQLARCEDA